MVRAAGLNTMALVAIFGLLAGCTGGKANADPPIVLGNGTVDQGALTALVHRDTSLSAAEREGEASTVDGALEREMWAASGLEAALGGQAAADSAFAETGAALTLAARGLDGAPFTIVGASYAHEAAPAPSVGAGMFAGSLTVDILSGGLVQATNGVADGETTSGTFADGGTASGSAGHVELKDTFTHESNGVTTTLTVTMGIDPCPDASGHFKGTATIQVSATASGGAVGQTATLDLTVTGVADDDAKLVSSDADYQVQMASVGGGASTSVDVSGSVGDTVATTVRSNGGSSGSAGLQQLAVQTGVLYAIMMKDKIAHAAELGWQSGRCVQLKVSASPGPTGLDPGATSKLTAAPRSRIDGGPVNGTVTAALSGAQSLDPEGQKVRADATFTYTAPDKKDQHASVAFEARSRRGVAKATLALDTEKKPYTASGGPFGSAAITISGTVADVAAPFTLLGTGDGVTVTFSYTPTSASGGSLAYQGTGAGFTLSGSGTYTISGADPDPLSLQQTENGCVNIGGCATTSETVTLTRKE